MTGPSSASITRRTALFITGATATVALSACAPKVRPLADSSASGSSSSSPSAASSSSASASSKASASASSGKSYKGPLKFDNYEKNGTYVPATETEKAKNVPKPLPPEHMNDRSPEGIYEFTGFWLAAINYLMLTGDSEPLKKADPADVYVKQFDEYVRLYQDYDGWAYGADTLMEMSLLADLPRQSTKNPNQYTWSANLTFNQDLKAHVDGSAPHKIAKSEGGRTYVGVEYKNGVWVMLTGHEDEASASASSASA